MLLRLAADSLVLFHLGFILFVLFGGLLVWIPFWLAWWLSDGFAGMSRWPGTGAPSVSGGVNPHTGKPCTVYHHPWGTTYVGGD